LQKKHSGAISEMSLINVLNEKVVIPAADRYMNTEIMKYYALIKNMSSWKSDEIRNWQDQRLRELINHAYNNTQYYKNLFNDNGLSPSDIKHVNDLSNIPITTKEDIINSPEKFIPQNISKIKYRNVATGGSSGNPLKYRIDLRSFSYVTALRYYYLGRIGYRLGDKFLVLGGRSVFPTSKLSLKYKLYHFLSRRTFLSGVNMSDEIADHHLNILTKKKIAYIFGYTTAIYLLACRAQKRNLRFPWIKACIATSEILFEEYRQLIKSAFGCEVIDVYGAGDGGISAYETEPGIYNVGYNCISENENSASDTNTGNILTTDLLNYASPFIRYRIGDQVSCLDPESAKNYYNGQIITKIWGRISEVIRLENGNVLIGTGFGAFIFSGLNIRAYRIKKVGYMHIECEIQKMDKFTTEEEDLIVAAFRMHAGEDCKITISYVKNFETLASGKRDYFISNSE
jgi:phenylacetate-CoA ligase